MEGIFKYSSNNYYFDKKNFPKALKVKEIFQKLDREIDLIQSDDSNKDDIIDNICEFFKNLFGDFGLILND